MNGKGDTPRPLSIPPEAFAQNWERIFEAYRRPGLVAKALLDELPDVTSVVVEGQTFTRSDLTLGDPDE